MNNKDNISRIDSFVGVKSFFKTTDITKLSRTELYDLTIKMAELDGKYENRAYFMIAMDKLNRTGEEFKFWLPVLISVVALLVSLFKV